MTREDYDMLRVTNVMALCIVSRMKHFYYLIKVTKICSSSAFTPFYARRAQYEGGHVRVLHLTGRLRDETSRYGYQTRRNAQPTPIVTTNPTAKH
jgi:hypothetical protein